MLMQHHNVDINDRFTQSLRDKQNLATCLLTPRAVICDFDDIHAVVRSTLRKVEIETIVINAHRSLVTRRC